MLVPADKERWEAERQEVLKKEEQQRQAEADAAAAKVSCLSTTTYMHLGVWQLPRVLQQAA